MLWWKAVHIIAVICWMAGILYLYRLFIYHNQETEEVVKARFEIMEKRLLYYITLPAMILTLVSGIAIIVYVPAFLKEGWLYAKILLVILMMGATHAGIPMMRKLKTLPHPYSGLVLRVLNEVPTLLMIAIVLLVVLKPF
ncbi:MAG: CopD family protein [Deltaproteobacteria bacterium]|nr:CopD family protein [Deltaproteobacteria bacterium]